MQDPPQQRSESQAGLLLTEELSQPSKSTGKLSSPLSDPTDQELSVNSPDVSTEDTLQSPSSMSPIDVPPEEEGENIRSQQEQVEAAVQEEVPKVSEEREKPAKSPFKRFSSPFKRGRKSSDSPKQKVKSSCASSPLRDHPVEEERLSEGENGTENLGCLSACMRRKRRSSTDGTKPSCITSPREEKPMSPHLETDVEPRTSESPESPRDPKKMGTLEGGEDQEAPGPSGVQGGQEETGICEGRGETEESLKSTPRTESEGTGSKKLFQTLYKGGQHLYRLAIEGVRAQSSKVFGRAAAEDVYRSKLVFLGNIYADRDIPSTSARDPPREEQSAEKEERESEIYTEIETENTECASACVIRRSSETIPPSPPPRNAQPIPSTSARDAPREEQSAEKEERESEIYTEIDTENTGCHSACVKRRASETRPPIETSSWTPSPTRKAQPRVSASIDLDQQEIGSPQLDVCSTKSGSQDKTEHSPGKDELSPKSAGHSPNSASTSEKSANSSPESDGPSTKSTDLSPMSSDPSTYSTDPSMKSSDPSTKSSDPFTYSSDPSLKSSDPSTKSSDPPTKSSDPTWKSSDPTWKSSDPTWKSSDPTWKSSDPTWKSSGTGTPPKSGGTCTPPKSGGTCTPPRSGDAGTPPKSGDAGTPPKSSDAGTPPKSGDAGTPPKSGGTGTSPKSGGTGTPPKSGGTGTPPKSGGTGTPPKSGGTGTPPKSGGTGTPPKSGGTGTPPKSGGTGTPPKSGGTGTPPKK